MNVLFLSQFIKKDNALNSSMFYWANNTLTTPLIVNTSDNT
jgi:hypothetical protein